MTKEEREVVATQVVYDILALCNLPMRGPNGLNPVFCELEALVIEAMRLEAGEVVEEK